MKKDKKSSKPAIPEDAVEDLELREEDAAAVKGGFNFSKIKTENSLSSQVGPISSDKFAKGVK